MLCKLHGMLSTWRFVVIYRKKAHNTHSNTISADDAPARTIFVFVYSNLLHHSFHPFPISQLTSGMWCGWWVDGRCRLLVDASWRHWHKSFVLFVDFPLHINLAGPHIYLFIYAFWTHNKIVLSMNLLAPGRVRKHTRRRPARVVIQAPSQQRAVDRHNHRCYVHNNH